MDFRIIWSCNMNLLTSVDWKVLKSLLTTTPGISILDIKHLKLRIKDGTCISGVNSRYWCKSTIKYTSSRQRPFLFFLPINPRKQEVSSFFFCYVYIIHVFFCFFFVFVFNIFHHFSSFRNPKFEGMWLNVVSMSWFNT